MGFFSRLIGMDGMAVATNAVLANYTAATMPQEGAASVLDQLDRTLMAGAGGLDPSYVKDILRRAGRISQLNMLAYAMMDLGMPPGLPSEVWMPRVRNPMEETYRSEQFWQKVRAAEDAVFRRHRLPVEQYRMTTEPLPFL